METVWILVINPRDRFRRLQNSLNRLLPIGAAGRATGDDAFELEVLSEIHTGALERERGCKLFALQQHALPLPHHSNFILKS